MGNERIRTGTKIIFGDDVGTVMQICEEPNTGLCVMDVKGRSRVVVPVGLLATIDALRDERIDLIAQREELQGIIDAWKKENKALREERDGMTEARDRFCGSLNRLAEIVGLSGKQSYAPEAVERKAKFELATLRGRVQDLEAQKEETAEMIADRLKTIKSLVARVKELDDRRFPIQGGPSIPWRMILPHDRQCRENHFDQSLEDIARRHGLSPAEAIAVLDDLRWIKSKWSSATEAQCRNELERRRAAFEDESIALRNMLADAAEATGIAGVDKPMDLVECILSLREQRDELAANDMPNWERLLAVVGGDASTGRGAIVEAVERLAECEKDVVEERDYFKKENDGLLARLKALEKEIETVNANWDADRLELEEDLANSVPLAPDEGEASREMLQIVHEIMTCDEEALPDGLCQCMKYIQAQFEGLRAEVKRLQAKVQYAKDFGLDIGIVKSSDCPDGRLGAATREGTDLHRLEMGIADLIEAEHKIKVLLEDPDSEVGRLKKAAVECDHRVFGCPVVTPEEVDLLNPTEDALEEMEGSAEVYGPGTIPGIAPSEEVVLGDATGPVVAERAGTGFVLADDEEEEEQPLVCSLCSCVIGDEVSFGYNMAPGEPVCDNCADGGEDDEESD